MAKSNRARPKSKPTARKRKGAHVKGTSKAAAAKGLKEISSPPPYPSFVAKRKYWIEWHFLFEKFPSRRGKDLDNLKEHIQEYITNYLNKYFDESYKHKGPGMKNMEGKINPTQTIPTEIVDDVHGFFDRGTTSSKSIQDTPEQFLEYHKWDPDRKEWVRIEAKQYGQIARKNMRPKNKKQALYFNVFTKFWMKQFVAEWEEVSGSQYVFTYRGWFEGKNNVRLSDATAATENKGTLNPPPPPPPPST